MEIYPPELIRKEGLRRGLSYRTIVTYNLCVKEFFRQCSKEDPLKVSKKDVQEYIDRLMERGCTGSTVNVHVSAIKFLYQEILNRRLLLRIRSSRLPKTMPSVLSKEETKQLISAISNPTHRLVIELMYSAGLRLSETVKMKVENIDFSQGWGWVRRGKGNKDRLFILSDRIKNRLQDHIRSNCPDRQSYLFTGTKNNHLSSMSVQRIIKQAAKAAGICKNIHPHTLRHSFSTHLVENGYDLPTVQALLGHSSPETTLNYLHTAPRINVRSPLDSL